MKASSLWIALIAAMVPAQDVLARAVAEPEPRAETRAIDDEPLLLAQYREVEVFYDEYGREIFLDPYTGEIVAVREPQRRPAYEEWPDRGGWDEPYYEDEWEEDIYSRRERRMRELGRGQWDDRPARPQWEEPQRGWADPQYESAAPGGVERAPLDETARLGEPDGDATAAIPERPRDGILEIEPDMRAIPDISQPPDMDLSGASEQVAKFQVLLSRVGASPGVIDGRIGDNVNKAITAYRDLTGETLRTYDQDYVAAQLQATGGDAFTTYEITAEDVAGPYVASVPTDYGEKAQMERLGYTSVVEMLAERFHMGERYLQALNPNVNFDRPGTIVRVANVARPQRAKVASIIADKGRKQLRAYDESGRLVVVYPATIGSQSTPSPEGSHTVERIALNPEYTYNPRINFQQGNNTRVLTIPPGPNGPVGTVWIALSKPTYGIHGTPEPAQIGRTYSNGCIRLTNWDAEELAGLVSRGVTVEFVE